MQITGDVAPERRYWLPMITAALLPVFYIPLEIGGSGTSLTFVMFGLVALCFFKYRPAMRTSVTGVDFFLLAFAGWIVLRLTLIALLSNETVDWGFTVRESLTLVAGFFAYRLARVDQIRRSIVLGLRIALVLMLTVEAYQYFTSLEHLRGLGYTWERGFNYYQVGGYYRPFGITKTPTIFGAQLAMVGVIVIATAKRYTVLLTAVIAIALAVTSTRSAWIGFAVAILFILAMGGKAIRSRLAVAGVLAIPVAVIAMLLNPAFFTSIWGRLMSITDGSNVSNLGRTTLWEGVVEAVRPENLVSGFGNANFITTLNRYIGSTSSLGHAHSNYFQILFRYGLIGLILFVAVIIAMCVVLRRNDQRKALWVGSVAAVLVFIIDSTFSPTFGSLHMVVTTFMLFGLGCSAFEMQSKPVAEAAFKKPASAETWA
ncbi:O-antigen ligase family protein [Rhodococcus globerulus]|uniref:O-antigen ligase family protein n=1 Tax=Rhodococcus globerulus TaxID=33008 RepID=UPI0039E96644